MRRRRAWLARSAEVILQVAPQPVRDEWTAEAIDTLHAVCADAHQRRGWVGFLATSTRELIGLLVAAAGARLGRRPPVTGGLDPKSRSPRRLPMITTDLRRGWRRLRTRPGLPLASVGMLGIAIGLATAMFTIVDALLIRPVPFRHPDRLAKLYARSERTGRSIVPPAVFRAWRESGVFEAVEATSLPGTVILDAGPEPLLRGAARVSPGLFGMLGVSPIRGRGFLPDEGRAGTEDRVVLSETVWRSLYGADPSLIGRSIHVDGHPHVLVGIMPKDFRYPNWDTVVWRPIDHLAPPPTLQAELPASIGRLPLTASREEVAARATDLLRAADPSMAKHRATLEPLIFSNRDEYYKRAVPLLAVGAGLVFLVLCANVSSLLLAQFTARRREYSMCSALGASRPRLIREAAVESVVLGVLGVAAGIALAFALVSLTRGLLPNALLTRSLNPINVDLRALIAASAAGVLATIVAGGLPAWIGTSVRAAGALGAAPRSSTETRMARLASRGLLIGEIALACTLLVGATLLVRSFINLSQADRGMRTRGVLTAWIGMPTATFKDAPSRAAMVMAIEESLRTLTGIQQVTISFGIPPGGGSIHFGDDWRSDIPNMAPLNLEVSSFDVRPDFFTFYEIPILRGRTFRPGDDSNTAIVGERLAGLLWPGVEATGRTFAMGKRVVRVIGVARETRFPTLEFRNDRPEFYTPMWGDTSQVMVSLRCENCPSLPTVRRHIEQIHAALRLNSLGVLEDEFTEQLARPRATAALGMTFAIIAVVAASGGLLSVLTYAVNRRRREFGIRVALGASTTAIRRLVLLDGAVVAAAGLALGSVGAWLLGRALSSMQYGVTTADPLSWSIVIAAIAATTLAAAWRPARQAMRVDPAEMLREE